VNILVLSAGRRVSLLRGFQRVVGPRGGRVLGADLSPEMSAACHVADESFVLPGVLSDEYPDALLEACSRHEIGLAIPTIDTELPVLASLREKFAGQGTEIVVSDPAFVDICADKRTTNAWFEQHALPVPKPMAGGALTFPAFAKPYDGSLSKGIHVLRSESDLTPAVLNDPKLIFSEYLDPADNAEFTCDLYFDRRHELRCVVPRERLVVRGGEVAKARTAKNEIVDELFEKLSMVPGARGCLTLQVFRNRNSGALAYIEINARFGGGYPLARHAGAEYERWLVEEYLKAGTIDRFDDWQDRLIMLRYDDEIVVGPRPGQAS